MTDLPKLRLAENNFFKSLAFPLRSHPRPPPQPSPLPSLTNLGSATAIQCATDACQTCLFSNSLIFHEEKTIHYYEESLDVILKGAMSHAAHVREEPLHLENVCQLFQVLRVIQYQEFIVFYLSHPLTVP